ncbi:primosomal protein N' (replication factor Y) [Lachnospiraceae bacterium PF1-21]|uniref:replication restart helicase PriA n=1 Tax=Ohessyouella blattaphilus TaxID=2949333 RepID=UPI003E2BEB87
MFADIIIDVTSGKLDRIFQYRIPEALQEKVKIGSRVQIPFGKGNHEISGYVVDITDKTDYEPTKIKDIAGILEKDIALEGKMVALAAWMKEHYGGTFVAALKTVMPIKKRENNKEEKSASLAVSREEAVAKLEHLLLYKNQKARVRALAALLDHERLSFKALKDEYQVTPSVLKALADQGLVKIETKRIFRLPQMSGEEGSDEALTSEQQKALDVFLEDYRRGEQKSYLIHGITGSGKTRLYLEMIEEVVKEGSQAIMLIPEIALTYQTVRRFYSRFGERLAIINSRLSLGERFDQMERVKNGEVDVMIGPRSALFTPFEKLGLIVIDEEHESSYKSEQMPRYHAREVAWQIAETEGAALVLGSATPSLEAYHACETGKYTLLKLENRATKGLLPEVRIVDMKEELKEGNRSILSEDLQEQIRERLARKEQTMLFINRRGYAGFVSCRECGFVYKCPHCDVSLAAHKNNRLVCHYCGYETQNQSLCPECGSKYIGGFKAGTQQIEELLKKEYPEARVLRMDRDTTREKGAFEKILKSFGEGEADILIGTQMIVKGHDYPNVTLVGILAADMSLYGNDYRSSERTFQLLTQAAGRAGRGEKKGEVIIQTYTPEHFSIQLAANHDYEEFYQREYAFREMMGYPPAEHLLAILLSSPEEELLERGAKYLKDFTKLLNKENLYGIIGPATPYVAKIKDVYRRVIYIKSEEYQALIHAKDKIEAYTSINRGYNKIYIQFDFDPAQGI